MTMVEDSDCFHEDNVLFLEGFSPSHNILLFVIIFDLFVHIVSILHMIFETISIYGDGICYVVDLIEVTIFENHGFNVMIHKRPL